MTFEWDPDKAAGNFSKHGVDFADAALVLFDDLAITIEQEVEGERRFITIGADPMSRDLRRRVRVEEHVLSTHLCPPGLPGRATAVRGKAMREEYDFSKGVRGAVIKTPPGKTRITIRFDNAVLDWFRRQTHKAGGGSYQTMMNDALREFIAQRNQSLEGTLRQVLREELDRHAARPPRPARRARTAVSARK